MYELKRCIYVCMYVCMAFFSQMFGSLLHNQAKMSCRMDRFVSILAVLSAVCSSLGLALGAIFPGDVALAAGPALMVIYVVLGSVGPAGSADEVSYLPRSL